MNERVLLILNHPKRNAVIGGVVAFASGVGVGYLLGRRCVSSEYGVHEVPEQIMTEIDVLNEDVERPEPFVIDAETYRSLDEIRIDELSLEPGGSGETSSVDRVEEPVEEIVATTVFAANDDVWNYEAELSTRNPGEPYVIHKDEFFAQENEYSQHTLTYYAGDNIMVDEEEALVYNVHQVVGDLKFGHGSGGDPNVFYVRNDKNRAEYEVLLHSGMFAVEVHGLDPNDLERGSMKHSATRFPRDD